MKLPRALLAFLGFGVGVPLGATAGCFNPCGHRDPPLREGTYVVTDVTEFDGFNAPLLEGATVTYSGRELPIQIVYTAPSGVRTTVVLSFLPDSFHPAAPDSGVGLDGGDIVRDGG